MTALEEAKLFLLDELGDGFPSQLKISEEARRKGISNATLRRAKKEMLVRSVKVGFIDGSEWLWHLPRERRNLFGRDARREMCRRCKQAFARKESLCKACYKDRILVEMFKSYGC